MTREYRQIETLAQVNQLAREGWRLTGVTHDFNGFAFFVERDAPPAGTGEVKLAEDEGQWIYLDTEGRPVVYAGYWWMRTATKQIVINFNDAQWEAFWTAVRQNKHTEVVLNLAKIFERSAPNE